MKKLLGGGDPTRDEVMSFLSVDKLHYGKLKVIFSSLSRNSVPNTYQKRKKVIRASAKSFNVFCDDLYLFNQSFTKSALRKMFRKYSLMNEVSSMFDFDLFVSLIYEVALQRKPKQKNVIKSLKKLLAVVYGSEKCFKYNGMLPLANWNDCKETEMLFWTYERPIHTIYEYYRLMKKKKIEKEKSEFQRKKKRSLGSRNVVDDLFQSVSRNFDYLDYSELVSLSAYFGITGDTVTIFEIRNVFKTLFRRKERECIDEEVFRTFLLRIAIFKHNRASSDLFGKRNHVILKHFLSSFGVPYFKLFSIKIAEELDNLELIKTPYALAVTPSFVSFNGGFVKVKAQYLDARKGGVFCKIKTKNKTCVFPYESISEENKQLCSIRIPRLSYDEERKDVVLKVEIKEIKKMKFEVFIFNYVKTKLYISNDEKTYSPNHLDFCYREELPKFNVNLEVSYELLKIYNDINQSEEIKGKNFWGKFLCFLKTKIVIHRNYIKDYFKNAENVVYHKGETFMSFLKKIVYFCCNEVRGCHPIDFMIDVVKKNQRIQSLEDFFVKTPLSLRLKSRREYDVYKGPLLICRIWEERRLGFRYQTFSSLFKNDFFRIQEFSENFNHLLSRILRSKFDIAPTVDSLKTRYPLSRCWRVFKGEVWKKGDKRVACFWEYKGSFASTFWCPLDKEFASRYATCCVYRKTEIQPILKLYKESKSITDFKQALIKKGYSIKLNVY